MAEINITIHEDGTVEIDGEGFNGKGCHEALGEYMKAIGKEQSSKKKADFYQKTQKVGQQNTVGGAGA